MKNRLDKTKVLKDWENNSNEGFFYRSDLFGKQVVRIYYLAYLNNTIVDFYTDNAEINTSETKTYSRAYYRLDTLKGISDKTLKDAGYKLLAEGVENFE